MNTRASLVTPRLDTKPWGGRKLGRYGIDLPAGERIGEALVTAGEATVTAGYGQGRTLGDLVRSDPAAHLGPVATGAVSGRAMFPLLVKIIDATQNLSIQVHPNDLDASTIDRLGKTEAWHVLDAEPGSLLYLGPDRGVGLARFREAAARLDGSTAPLMRTIPAQPGTTVLIPAGTIHALGAGVLVYEVQQPSDVTYRLDDWGRVDDQGQSREVHLAEGFAVARPDSMPGLIEPIELGQMPGEHQILAACRYFALERLALPEEATLEIGRIGSPCVVTMLAGDATIEDLALTQGSSAVVWPTAEPTTMVASVSCVALLTYVPDLDTDVVERARLAGATACEISALGGGTGDLDGAPKR